MKTLIKLGIVFSLLASAWVHAGKSLPKFALKNEGKSIAIVSLAANNWGNSLDSINSDQGGDDLVDTQLNKMLGFAEEKFAEAKFKVIPAKSYVNKKEFLLLAGEPRTVGLPVIDGTALPLMADNRKQMVKCRLSKKKAIALTEATGADYVVVMYSEWALKTGNFVPTTKALAKNVIGIYNNKGKQVYFNRSDKLGNRTLGAGGLAAVNEGTIGQWVLAYEKGLDALFAGKR